MSLFGPESQSSDSSEGPQVVWDFLPRSRGARERAYQAAPAPAPSPATAPAPAPAPGAAPSPLSLFFQILHGQPVAQASESLPDSSPTREVPPAGESPDSSLTRYVPPAGQSPDSSPTRADAPLDSSPDSSPAREGVPSAAGSNSSVTQFPPPSPWHGPPQDPALTYPSPSKASIARPVRTQR